MLEGSVRKAGDRVRVTAQLVDASNGHQLWSERYDRQLADIFDVQDEIARTIVGRLKVALAAGATSRLVKATTSNMDAYHHYLKGRAMLYRRGPWNARALESFLRAVGLDPGYAQAWAGVADAYTVLCYSGDRRPADTMPAALDAATRATVGDPGSAEAHNALAVAALLWERDLEKAEREFLDGPVQHAGAHAAMIVRRRRHDRELASKDSSKRATPILRPSGRRDHDATRSLFHRCPRDGPRGRRSCSVPDPGVRELRRHLVRQRAERGSRLVA